jgi:AraC-like DNA-binding protein
MAGDPFRTSHDRGIRPAGPPAYGALARLAKDNLYWLPPTGFIFTSPWVVTPDTVRHSAVILLTASGDPFEIDVCGITQHGAAVAIAPLVRRGLRARQLGLVSINVFPTHPAFGRFCRIPAPGVLQLDRGRFRHLDADIARAYEGRLDPAGAAGFLHACMDAVAPQLPPCNGAHDRRCSELHALLRDHPDCSLVDLARALELSYTGASHLFSRSVGLPLRSYHLWRKRLMAAEMLFRGVRLTDVAHAAGFTDSSHLCRTWQASYGLTPSRARDPGAVRIVS